MLLPQCPSQESIAVIYILSFSKGLISLDIPKFHYIVSYKQAVTTGKMTLAGRILPARSRTKEGIVVTVKAGSVIEEKVRTVDAC